MGEIQNIGTAHLQHMGREEIIAESEQKKGKSILCGIH
jgi:UDP-N-acetylmuramyl pentapeptide synthase